MLEWVQSTNGTSGVMFPDGTRSHFVLGREAALPGFVEQPQSSTPGEAPQRQCPKCGSPMIGEAKPKSDLGPSYYYLCRKCNFGFTTAMLDLGTPVTQEQRRLAHIDSAEKLIEKSEKTLELHEKLFPLPGVPQINASLAAISLHPSLSEIAEKSKPKPSIREVLERSKSLIGVVAKMKAAENREIDERIKPFMKIVKELNEERRREEARAKPIPTKYDAHGRITGIPDKPVKR